MRKSSVFCMTELDGDMVFSPSFLDPPECDTYLQGRLARLASLRGFPSPARVVWATSSMVESHDQDLEDAEAVASGKPVSRGVSRAPSTFEIIPNHFGCSRPIPLVAAHTAFAVKIPRSERKIYIPDQEECDDDLNEVPFFARNTLDESTFVLQLDEHEDEPDLHSVSMNTRTTMSSSTHFASPRSSTSLGTSTRSSPSSAMPIDLASSASPSSIQPSAFVPTDKFDGEVYSPEFEALYGDTCDLMDLDADFEGRRRRRATANPRFKYEATLLRAAIVNNESQAITIRR